MLESNKTILITGANKGIGYFLAEELCRIGQYCVIITSRNQQLGRTSFQKLRSQFTNAALSYYQLDITSCKSIERIVKDLEQSNIKIDILINNAAVGYDQPYEIPSKQIAISYFNCNYFATVQVTKQLLQFLTQNAKIINVSSRTGALQNHSIQIQQKLRNPDISQEIITGYINDYIQGCSKKELKGYYPSAYSTSKTFLNIWTSTILPRYLKMQQSAILMSPGFCLTDMVKNSFRDPRTKAPEPKSPEEGIKTLVYCIRQIPHKNTSSVKFYHNCKQWNIQQTS